VWQDASALATAVIAVASVTLAAASPTSTSADRTVTIQVLEHQVNSAGINVGTPGPSLGDRLVSPATCSRAAKGRHRRRRLRVRQLPGSETAFETGPLVSNSHTIWV